MDLADGLDEDAYEERLTQAQSRLLHIQHWMARTRGRAIVAIESQHPSKIFRRLSEQLRGSDPIHFFQKNFQCTKGQATHKSNLSTWGLLEPMWHQ
jgi:hypothetical protein